MYGGPCIDQEVIFRPVTADARAFWISCEHSGMCTGFTISYGFTEGSKMDSQ